MSIFYLGGYLRVPSGGCICDGEVRRPFLGFEISDLVLFFGKKFSGGLFFLGRTPGFAERKDSLRSQATGFSILCRQKGLFSGFVLRCWQKHVKVPLLVPQGSVFAADSCPCCYRNKITIKSVSKSDICRKIPANIAGNLHKRFLIALKSPHCFGIQTEPRKGKRGLMSHASLECNSSLPFKGS